MSTHKDGSKVGRSALGVRGCLGACFVPDLVPSIEGMAGKVRPALVLSVAHPHNDRRITHEAQEQKEKVAPEKSQLALSVRLRVSVAGHARLRLIPSAFEAAYL
jgi:hypothetical protein